MTTPKVRVYPQKTIIQLFAYYLIFIQQKGIKTSPRRINKNKIKWNKYTNFTL